MISSIIVYIVKSLTHIWNVSFTIVICPMQVKKVEAIPIYKSGDRNLFANYIFINFIGPVLTKNGNFIL